MLNVLEKLVEIMGIVGDLIVGYTIYYYIELLRRTVYSGEVEVL